MDTIKAPINMTGCVHATLNVPKYISSNDYESLINLPQIEGVTLIKNKTFAELGMEECTNQEIINLFK